MTDHIIARANGSKGSGHFTPAPKASNAKQPFSAGPHIAGMDDDPALPADEMSALESRAEVDSLGDLHARRRQLMTQLAPLQALYGAFGLWDSRRKQLLESLKVRARMALSTGEKRPTEAQIDAAAHADPQYEKFLDDSYDAKVQFINMDTELSEIQERIRNRELAIMAFTAECRMAR